MDEAWIGFAGAVIGGLLTLVGVFLTILYYKSEEKNKAKRMSHLQCEALFWFFEVKGDLLKEWNKLIEDVQDPKEYVSPSGNLVPVGDDIFLFERIQYLNEALDDAEITSLLEFFARLKTLQEARDVVDNCKNDQQRDQAYRDMFIPFFDMTKEFYNDKAKKIISKLHKK